MSNPAPLPLSLQTIAASLRRHAVLWIVPALACTALAIAYVVIRAPQWRVSQALVLRDEIGGNPLVRQGRFDTAEAMKAAQETIVQLARDPALVEAALQQVGPPASENAAPPPTWPSPDAIQRLQSQIVVGPPKGGEFGRNEVIVLSVTGPTRDRALALNRAVCAQLDRQLQSLRRSRAKSLIVELENSAAVAQRELDAATLKLEQLESQAGRNLDELRTLSETSAGTSNLRTSANQLKEEIRRVQITHDANALQHRLLSEARQDPQALLTAPQRLFDALPSLRRLRDGLVDAQLRTAQLVGRMSHEHPEVRSAVAAEQEVRRQLAAEVDLVAASLASELQVSGASLASLQGQFADVEDRLNQIASLRAPYANQLADVRQRNENLSKIRKDLSDARASESSANSATILTRLNDPDPGTGPIGPSALVVVAGGCAGGLLAGLGLVFLITPFGERRRRWSDYLGFGRRASDRPAASPSRTAPAPYPISPSDSSAVPVTPQRRAADRDQVPADPAPPV